MGFKDFAADFGNRLIGNIAKAKLTIVSLDAGRTKVKKERADKPSAGQGAMPNVGILNEVAASTAASILTNIPKGRQEEIQRKGHDYLMKHDVNRYEMEVLFNPSELRISGHAGGNIATMNYRNANLTKGQVTGATISPAQLNAQLTLNLILDRTDNQFAFAADKFTLSATSIAKGVGKSIMTGAGGKNNSVQYEVEALNAAVRDPRRRLLIFTWGDMEYQGLLNSVSGEYVMFNINGEPCRAKVRLTMTLMDSKVFASAASIWAEHYDQGLGGKTGAAGALGDLAEAVQGE